MTRLKIDFTIRGISLLASDILYIYKYAFISCGRQSFRARNKLLNFTRSFVMVTFLQTAHDGTDPRKDTNGTA